MRSSAPLFSIIFIAILQHHFTISDTSFQETNRRVTHQIINPLLHPLLKLFDIMENNIRQLEHADEIAKKQYDEKLPESIFDLLTPKPTTTTPKPIIERLFEPFLNPIKNELNKFKEATEMTKRNHQRISEHGRLPISNDNEIVSPNVMTNSDSARRSPSKFVDDNKITSQSSYDDHEGPQIMSLLESFGQNVHKDDEMHVGRDKSVNILGMPVGRRDGLIFNPLNGISLGNQDMYGPVAINDKYNINWGFIDKIGRLIDSLSDKV